MIPATPTAVVLAAGMGTRLRERGYDQPKGFLQLGARPIIEESLDKLRDVGVRRVVIVTGHCSEWYERLAADSGGFVETCQNPRYAESGSMFSLACARDSIEGNFLLLESDLIFEKRALQRAIEFPRDTCVLLSGLTHSSDEVFVETNADRLVAMSKDRTALGSVAGELVGITKVSSALYAEMLAIADAAFRKSLALDYETDCLVAAAQRRPVYCEFVEDLAWAEIDDESHLQRATDNVYPEILRRDRAA